MQFRSWIAAGLGAWAIAFAVAAAASPVPPALEPWREWVLHGHEEKQCPAQNGDAAVTHCRWPGRLAIEASASGATFTQRWTIYAPQRVPLPGDDRWRPIDVRVDGRDAPVVFENGQPMLELAPGEHEVSGRIVWTQRPPTLPLPDEIAWLTLSVDGAAIALPQRNEDGELVLGATGSNEGDALQLEAYRLLADGSPAFVATRVELSVTGKPREQVLGPILPPGYIPVALDGEIPMRWEPDGKLRLQVRPGFWSVTVIARAPADATTFTAPSVPEPWVAQEIWQFRADPSLRIAQLEGVPGVDPEQANVPDWMENLGEETAQRWHWMLAEANALPTFALASGATATLAVSLRGLPPSRPPRLSLSRELWLAFDGSEFVARDRVAGDLGGLQRLDMRAPWVMEEARRDGENSLLITAGTQPGHTGFEWRDREVAFESGARVARGGVLPASGWTQPFDSAQAVLQLPPGYRLLGAAGVDRAEGSWIARWSLLDLFLASVTLLLAWRVKPPALMVALLGWLLWSWHEPDAPRLTLLLLLGVVLVLRYVPAGRWQRIVSWMRYGLLALVAIWSLLFAATQLQLAIYPQLEHHSVTEAYDGTGGNYAGVDNDQEVQMQFSEPPPQPASAPSLRVREESLDRIEVTGSKIKQSDLFQYPTDAIPQAGRARPEWQWHRHALVWNGPLLADEELDLWISPPWLTRLLRVAAVALLGIALTLLLRPAAPRPARPRRATAAASVGGLAIALAFVAFAQTANAQVTPDSATLDELRTRLLAKDEPCRPDCASLAEASVQRNGARVTLSLDAHAQAQVAWPLPREGEGQALVDVRVDGGEAAVLRDDAGAWVLLERGVHRVEATYASDEGRWRIAFPLPPAHVAILDESLETSGLDENRLIGDTLELIAAVSTEANEGESAQSTEAVPPFVRVRRYLVIDQQWELRTTIERIAPARGGLTVPVPLLRGELPLANAPPVRDGAAMVSLAAGADSVSWSSRLTPADTFELQATPSHNYSEEWVIAAAPLLHVETAGLPESSNEAGDVRRFVPLPGEKLQLTITRPVAVEGNTLAIEGVKLHVTPGQRARDSRLDLTLRATRAGQHLLSLPADSELLGLWINGAEQPRVLNEGRVALALRNGPQSVAVHWREPVAIGALMRSPELDLGAPAGNLRISIAVPQDRWLLAASGPGVGPALLYWSQLALLVIVALVLARFGGTPLKFHHWLLLGLGFSTVSWLAAAIVAGWLLLLGWRGRRTAAPANLGFTLLQLVVLGATAVALLCLVAAVPAGLLGRPDMQVVGNGSWGEQLNWFLDRSDGALPAASAWSLPMWAYKVAILAWALWLANALIGWLRWGWQCYARGGWWYWPKRVKPQPAPAVTEAVAPSGD